MTLLKRIVITAITVIAVACHTERTPSKPVGASVTGDSARVSVELVYWNPFQAGMFKFYITENSGVMVADGSSGWRISPRTAQKIYRLADTFWIRRIQSPVREIFERKGVYLSSDYGHLRVRIRANDSVKFLEEISLGMENKEIIWNENFLELTMILDSLSRRIE